MSDMMGNPLQTSSQLSQKEKDLYSKIKDTFRTSQQKNYIMNESQLESLNLNLKTTHKFFSPENLITRNPKGIDQLYALVVNMKKELSEKIPDENLAGTYLSSHGIALSKIEKEISDLKNYVQTRYDLTTDMKKHFVSEKFFFADNEKFFQNIRTMSLRKAINETNNHPNKIKKENKVSGNKHDEKMIGLCYEELRKLEAPHGRSEEAMVEDFRHRSAQIRGKPSFTTDKKGYEQQTGGMTAQTLSTFTPIKNKNFSNNILGMKTSNISTSKQTDTVNASRLILNNLLKSRNVLNLKQDESHLQLFDAYFSNMKSYLYFKTNNELVADSSNFMFSASEVSKFNSSSEKSNLYPLSYTLHNICNYFGNVNRDNSRKNVFDLLLHQISTSNNQSFANKQLTVNKMLNNTTNYYEQDFLKKVLNLAGENIMRIDLNGLQYATKHRAIENYVNSVIYGRLMTSTKDRNIDETDKLKIWATIYYLLRCGLEEECLQFILNQASDDNELANFHTILYQTVRETLIDFEVYSQLIECIKNKHESEINPFRHCCFVLVTKISQTINDLILENLEDYIWFHLKLIIENTNYQKLKEKNILRSKFFTLKEFQDYIKRCAPENFESETTQFQMDYAKCLFSILLFEDGVSSLSKHDENLVDVVNISLILKDLGLFRNFHTIDKKNILECSTSVDENDYMVHKWVETFAETFMNSRMFPVMNYLKYLFHGNNLLEKISNIINNTGRYDSLLTPEDFFFDISKSKKLNFFDLFGKDAIFKLVSYVVKDAINTSSENKSNYEMVIKLAKKYEMNNELLELIINDCVEIITMKTPKKIYKPQIHLKGHLVSKVYTDTLYDIKISDKYRNILEEFGSNYSKYDDHFKINFKYLRQLETIEEIYDLINKNNENKALEIFVKHVTYIPFQNEKKIAQFMNNSYPHINDLLKNIYPDVKYLNLFNFRSFI